MTPRYRSICSAEASQEGHTIRRSLLATPLAAVLLMASCGGDGGGSPPTLESYLKQVQSILQDSNKQFADLGSHGLTPGEIQDPAEAVSVEKKARDIIGGSLDGLRALKAPEEAKREHEELVVAANDYVHELDSFIGQLQGAQTADDVRALFAAVPGTPLDQAAQRLDTSCLQLQDVATARQTGIDLGCGN